MEPAKGFRTYPVREKPELTENEREIFGLMRGFVEEEGLKTVLRVAGGWVRDKVFKSWKLLGKDCKDIDLAIDNMTGEDFLTQARAFFKRKGMDQIHGFGVIKSNPDKSKHLETATAKIKDVWIDFVNLRGETYDPETRVPTMRMGTAEEDAFRRDLTINALFYNLMTDSIEDFTKRGLEDLRNGVVRTPLKPYSTFFDDPLRILRTFRFASRFGFRVAEEIFEALKSEEIRSALRSKVSRERVGIELNLILNHESAFDCLSYYYENGLWDIVFDPRGFIKEIKPEVIAEKSKIGYDLCRVVYAHRDMLDKFEVLKKSLGQKQTLFFAYLTGATLPFAEFRVEKNKQVPTLMAFIVKESLKFSNKELNMIVLLESSIALIRDLVHDPRDLKHKVIRWIKQNGDSWELAFFLALMLEKQMGSQQPLKDYEELYDFIQQEKLSLIFNIKPLLDGGEIIKTFGIKPGPNVKIIQDNIFMWQIENQEKGKEELIAAIKENKEHFLTRNE